MLLPSQVFQNLPLDYLPIQIKIVRKRVKKLSDLRSWMDAYESIMFLNDDCIHFCNRRLEKVNA